VLGVAKPDLLYGFLRSAVVPGYNRDLAILGANLDTKPRVRLHRDTDIERMAPAPGDHAPDGRNRRHDSSVDGDYGRRAERRMVDHGND
jgi:hypothetical protein